jgi:GTP-binding protein
MPFFFQQSRFHITVAELAGLPDTELPEIAFVGRSNAGKSSTINTLTIQRKLAFISKMPGRTQHLNFFEIMHKKEGVGFLVDLPGYGYAKMSKSTSSSWDGFLGGYLSMRRQLKGLVLIMDSRHPMTNLDKHMINWFAQTKKPIYIVLTKSDKLNKTEQAKSVQQCKQELLAMNLDPNIEIQMQLFSSLKKIGTEELSLKLQTWLV